MRKILSLFVALAIAFLVFGQNIGVQLSPSKAKYSVGDVVKILWNSTAVPSSARVKITLWRQGATQSTCRIAMDVPIGNGMPQGYSWTIPSTCVNPHTNATENLVNGKFKIRVRWQGHAPAVYGESGFFKVEKKKSSIFVRRIPPLGLDPVELAVFMHGPGPVIINTASIKRKLEEKEIKTPVIVEIYRGNQLIKTIGKFVPVMERGRVTFPSIPERWRAELNSEQRETLEKAGKCKIVVKTAEGEILSEVEVPVKVKSPKEEKPIRR